MIITRINVNDRNAQIVEQMALSLDTAFRRIDKAQACIVADFPKISNSPIDFFIWLRVPFGAGGYRAGTAKEPKDRPFLNNMAFTIRIVETIHNLAGVYGSNAVKKTAAGEDAEWDLYAERVADQRETERFVKERTGIKYFFCQEVIWLKGYKSTSVPHSKSTPLIFFDDTILNIEDVINQVAGEIMLVSKFQKGFYSFPDKTKFGEEYDMSALISSVIEAANEGSRYGILTKKKLEKITRLVQNTEKIIDAQNEGGKICIVTGKAGSGKTLALSRVIYQIASSGKHARFLTYNHMLALDMKQTLRALSLKVSTDNNQRLDSSNVSCQTIHKFFFDLAKDMGVISLVSEERFKELQSVCKDRISLAKTIFQEYLNRHKGELPSSTSVVLAETYMGSPVPAADRSEVRNCIDSILYAIKYRPASATQEPIQDVLNKEFGKYEISRMVTLSNLANADVFNSDYFKVLEILYAKIVQPTEFLYRKEQMSRQDFLKWVSAVNPNTTDQEIYSQVNAADLQQVQEQINLPSASLTGPIQFLLTRDRIAISMKNC